jgi:hypothetical protein
LYTFTYALPFYYNSKLLKVKEKVAPELVIITQDPTLYRVRRRRIPKSKKSPGPA